MIAQAAIMMRFSPRYFSSRYFSPGRFLSGLHLMGMGAVAALLTWGPAAWACGVDPMELTAMPETYVSIDAETGPVAAWYDGPTTRYPHGVLGDPVEATQLAVALAGAPNCGGLQVTLPISEVYEDTAPRLADLNGDGNAEIVTIQSNQSQGARLVIYGITENGQSIQIYAETDPIGQRFRWLAPVGMADFNADGVMDIAYIDRPHLAFLLRIITLHPTGPRGFDIEQISFETGFTNHINGDDFLMGGLRDCGPRPEMVLTDPTITHTYIVGLTDRNQITSRTIGPATPDIMARALNCAD
jgi:hypothetical protein